MEVRRRIPFPVIGPIEHLHHRFPLYSTHSISKLCHPFLLKCDASKTAIGAMLAQEFEDGEHPLGYFSRTLKPAEKNYSAYDLEGLAIVEALRHFRHIVSSSSFH